MLQRTISGIAFAVIAGGLALWPGWGPLIISLVVSVWGMHEFIVLLKKRDVFISTPIGLALSASIVLSFVQPWWPTMAIVPLIMSVGLLGIFWGADIKSVGACVAGLVWIALPCGLYAQVTSTGNWALALGILVLIWANDTFAYLGGRTFGKHLLMPKFSPKKTIEGYVSGVIATGLLGWFLGDWLFGGNHILSLMIGLAIAFAATPGDLIESALKRWAGVKDSGKVLPGHGGILDRFDAFLFCQPFVAAVLALHLN